MAATPTDKTPTDAAPHIPVLIRPLIAAVAPVSGTWIDGTFGAGGYTRALLEAGAELVIAIDRDPLAFELAREWLADFPGRVRCEQTVFSAMDKVADAVDGVVLDLGVSSMQLDLAERGFSFMRDGPLDMRMSQEGTSAADLVNTLPEEDLAAILFVYGEERASRRIAKNIVRARSETPFETTRQLAEVIERSLPRKKPGQSHPATRSFQALRIAVNDEYRELFEGLMAAERVLKPGGMLAVVTFHSVEDRMVKRFFQARAGHSGNINRYAPQTEVVPAQFEVVTRKAVSPDKDELAENPRSRSARLRVGRRTDIEAGPVDPKSIAMPQLKGEKVMRSFLYVTTVLAVIGLAFWAYHENYKTQEAIEKTAKLQRQIGFSRSRLSVLRAEWAYLNRPDRLRDLAELNFDRLGLLPLRPAHFGNADQVAFPIVETDDFDPITNSVSVSSQNADGRQEP